LPDISLSHAFFITTPLRRLHIIRLEHYAEVFAVTLTPLCHCYLSDLRFTLRRLLLMLSYCRRCHAGLLLRYFATPLLRLRRHYTLPDYYAITPLRHMPRFAMPLYAC